MDNLCLITGIFPPDIGGPATYVSRLAHELSTAGYAVQVITLGHGPREAAFPVRRVSRSYPWPLRLLLVFFLLIWHGRRSRIWYINGLELPAVLAGKLLRKRLIMKIVSDQAWERALNQELSTASVLDFQQTRQHWKVELHKALRAWLPRQVERVITPSQHVKALVAGWGCPLDKIEVIYNAVEELPELPDTQQAARRQFGLPDSARIIITVGRLIPLKGIEAIIQAAKVLWECSEEHADVRLLVVGDGPDYDRLAGIANACRMTDRVHFLGRLERAAALAYVRAADVFVLNSSTEGFSHVLLEAMMVGVPVVATAVGGNVELIAPGENGWLIEEGNFNELVECLRKALSHDPTSAYICQQARHSARQYSWERLLRQTLSVLEGTPPVASR